MKTLMLAILTLLASPTLPGAELKIEVRNPRDGERMHEVVAVEWKALQRLDGISPENARVRDASGKILLCQPVDNDGDGAIDELLFMADLAGNETKRFTVVSDASLKMPEAAAQTFARYVPERKDDFAWENDLIAFRVYGPALKDGNENCGVDCWMKRVNYPIIDKWYQAEQEGKDYHSDRGEGYDGYHTGRSLGCGGSAVWRDGKMFQSNVYTAWKVFANGPIRSVFELSYGPWEVGGRRITEKKRVTIDLGSRLFKVDDAFFVEGEPAKLDMVIGVTTHDGKAQAYENRKKGYLYCWEKIDGHHLGTGIALSPDVIKEYMLVESEEPEKSHAMYVVSTADNGKITYYAGYGWEKAKQIVSREQWESYLAQFAEKTETPLEVTVE